MVVFLCQVSLGILQDWNEEMIRMFVFSAVVEINVDGCCS